MAAVENVGESSSNNQPLFPDIQADGDMEVTEIESLCVECEKQGTTRLFLTRIPFFKEVILSSFNCPHCGFQNSELQPGSRIQEKGVKYTVTIVTEKDLNRQIVQTSYATLSIPSLDFEIPPKSGVLTTVEGIIDRAVAGLQQDQAARRRQHPEVAAQLDDFVIKLLDLKMCKTPFDLIIDDPSGNSFIENPNAPAADKQMTVTHYVRTKEQDELLCIYEAEDDEEEKEPVNPNEAFNPNQEVVTFPSNCPSCNAPCPTNMKMVDIPFFKQVVIMATTCDKCNYRDNEVKGGAGIEPKGVKITLHITKLSDMTRDLLKSDTSSVGIPELELTTDCGTLGGRFTTVEGILTNITEQLTADNPFFHGDSHQQKKANRLVEFCDKIKEIISGKRLGVHLVLDDPAGNSYLQNVNAPDPDPAMEIIHYERSAEQNAELGLDFMNTENYETT